MPDGTRLSRKFFRNNKLGDVMNYVKKSSKQSGIQTVKFVTTFPKKVFDNADMTLEEAKFGKQESLNVDCK